MWMNHVWGSEAPPQRMKLRIWYLGRRGVWQTSSPLRWGTWGGPSLHLLLLLLVPSIQSIIWGKGHKLQTKDLQEHEASAAQIYVGLASSSDSLCFTFLIIRIKIFVWQFSLLNFVVLVCRHQIKRWRRSFDSKTEEKWSILLLETIRRWKKSLHVNIKRAHVNWTEEKKRPTFLHMWMKMSVERSLLKSLSYKCEF